MSSSDTPAPAEPDAVIEAAPRRRRLLLVLTSLAALLAVATVALGVLLYRAQAVEDRRQDVLTAARQSALNLTSIDNEDFEQDVQLVLDGATGAFRADFEARAQDLQQVLTENEVVSEGTVVEAGIVRSDETTATALVVVDGNVRNTAAPDGRVNTYRMKLELELQGGRWLTSMLEFVG